MCIPLRGIYTHTRIDKIKNDKNEKPPKMKTHTIAKWVLSVGGDPKPKETIRRVTRAGRIFTYQPHNHWIAEINRKASRTMFLYPNWPTDVRYAVRIDLPGRTKPKGDVDNYAKGVLDALTGVLWKNDKQVDRLIVVRNYRYVSGTEIRVRAFSVVSMGTGS